MMNLKKISMLTLSLALTAGSSMTSFAAAGAWQKSGDEFKYRLSSGDYVRNDWVLEKNNWYYLGDDATMQRGWQQINNKWYFLANSGQMLAGLINVEDTIYYMDGNTGELMTTSRIIRDKSYDFTEHGTTNGKPYLYESWYSNGNPNRAAPIKVR